MSVDKARLAIMELIQQALNPAVRAHLNAVLSTPDPAVLAVNADLIIAINAAATDQDRKDAITRLIAVMRS